MSTNSLGSAQHLSSKFVSSALRSVASSKHSNSKVTNHTNQTGSEQSEDMCDDSSMKKPTVSALQHIVGFQQQLSVKQKLANFHAKL